MFDIVFQFIIIILVSLLSLKEHIKSFICEHYGQKVVIGYKEIARIKGIE